MACKAAWHGGETCEAYQERRLEEQDDDKIADTSLKKVGMQNLGKGASLRQRQKEEEEEAAKTLSKVSKLCPGCERKVQKNG